MPVAERMTAEEFLALPERPDSRRWELVDGEIVVSEPNALHGTVVVNLLYALETWARSKPGRGAMRVPLDVRLDRVNVYAPDILWYAEGRVPVWGPPPYPMPDLAIEVRSPSTWRYDIGAKKSGYERHGLPELWLIDTTADQVLAFRRATPGAPTFDVSLELDRDQRLASPLLAGFALPLADVFPPR